MRLLLGQTGAPTPVLNRSIAGFVAATSGHDVRVVRGGPTGLLDGAFETVSACDPAGAWVAHGGSVIGGGRHAMTTEDIDRIVDVLEREQIDGLCLIGGNGTMALLEAIGDTAVRRGVPLRTVGVPKTIDNDLTGVDHTPGFASAARILATLLPDIARDFAAMASVERVRIVETMGRNTGWLAAAATYPSAGTELAPGIVVTPEVGWSLDDVLDAVRGRAARDGHAFVVVSEGVLPELTDQPVNATNHATLISGGVARLLAEQVGARLNLPVRAEVIGVVQRCAAALASPVDAHEAETVGRIAGMTLGDADATAVMVGLDRACAPDYVTSHPLIPLADAVGTRRLPEAWRSTDPASLTEFHQWLRPLVDPLASAAPTTVAMEAS